MTMSWFPASTLQFFIVNLTQSLTPMLAKCFDFSSGHFDLLFGIVEVILGYEKMTDLMKTPVI